MNVKKKEYVMEMVKLNNGILMPQTGIGTLQMKNTESTAEYIYEAICRGVRMIDTAAAYFNEEAVGNAVAKAIQEGVVQREDLFIVTKLWIQDANKDTVRKALNTSLSKLHLDYLDLYLVHQPYGKYLEAWPVMNELMHEGKLKSVGVCNFSEEKLKELVKTTGIKPQVNQIELHPFYQQKETVAYMEQQSIVPMAWGPLAEGQLGIFNHPILSKIAAKHHRSIAQVVLRWEVESGYSVIPRSQNIEHLEENINIWNFELDEQDHDEIGKLDLKHSEIVDFNNPLTEKWLREIKVHD